MTEDLRASDEDRLRVIAGLERHTAAGRLTLDEFSDRVAEVYAARTLAELATVGRDLPADIQPATPAPVASRHLLVAFAVAVAVLILLGALVSLR